MVSPLTRVFYRRPLFSANEWWEMRPKLNPVSGRFHHTVKVWWMILLLLFFSYKNFFIQTTFVNDLPLFSLSNTLHREHLNPPGTFPYGGQAVEYNTTGLFHVLKHTFAAQRGTYEDAAGASITLVKPSFLVDSNQISVKLTPMRYLIDNSTYSLPGTAIVNLEFKHVFTAESTPDSPVGPPHSDITYDMLGSGPLNARNHNMLSLKFIKEKVEPLYTHNSQTHPLAAAATYSCVMKFLTFYNFLCVVLFAAHYVGFCVWFHIQDNKVFQNRTLNWFNVILALVLMSCLFTLVSSALILSLVILGSQTNSLACYNCFMNFVVLAVLAECIYCMQNGIWETYHLFRENESTGSLPTGTPVEDEKSPMQVPPPTQESVFRPLQTINQTPSPATGASNAKYPHAFMSTAEAIVVSDNVGGSGGGSPLRKPSEAYTHNYANEY